MSVVPDRYRGTNQEDAGFGVLVVVPLLVGLLRINNALGAGLSRSNRGHAGGGMRRGPVIKQQLSQSMGKSPSVLFSCSHSPFEGLHKSFCKSI